MFPTNAYVMKLGFIYCCYMRPHVLASIKKNYFDKESTCQTQNSQRMKETSDKMAAKERCKANLDEKKIMSHMKYILVGVMELLSKVNSCLSV